MGRLIVAEEPAAPRPSPDAEGLIELIDRLERLLERSGLAELEVEAGETALVLRSPAALVPALDPDLVAALRARAGPAEGPPAEAEVEQVGLHAVLAPLTGIFYVAPAPDASPYVRPGDRVEAGQVIGLIEAMKLFNEIKSDVSGKVVRIAAENGTLVKAKQPLLEVET